MAEILSRYYDKDVSMHSYDNGIGVKVKKDNWDQLLRLFARVPDLEPLAAARADVEAIIHCQNGAAVAFLCKLYQCLTKRTIAPPAAVAPAVANPAVANGAVGTPADIPPYAKPTGSALIREKMRASPEIAETQDEVQRGRFARDVQSQHEEQLQQQRGDSAGDRYPALRSATKATVLRGPTKPVRNDDAAIPMLSTQNIVKEVQIKALNGKGLEKLRATREAKENEALGIGLGGGPGGSNNGLGATFDGYGGMNSNGSGSSPELLQRRRPLDLLNESVGIALTSMGVSRGSKDHRAFESFVEIAYATKDADSNDIEGAASLRSTARVFNSLIDSDGGLALACLEFPREFWKFVGLVWSFLSELDVDHMLFRAVLKMLCTIGTQCTRRDSTASTLLLTEYIIPRCSSGASIPLRSAAKRNPLLQLIVSYVPQSALAHLQTVKRLREALSEDIPLFIHCLAVMLDLHTTVELLATPGEDGESDADVEALVDLYHYYCCIGLEASCEKLRAACLSMLTALLRSQSRRRESRMAKSVVSLVVDLLPRLTQLSARYAWWEVKAQLLLVASEFLLAAPAFRDGSDGEQDFTEQIEQCLTIVEREFHPASALHVRRVGLVGLAPVLSSYQELVPLYVDVLLSVPEPIRRVMLEPDPEHGQEHDHDHDHGHDEEAVAPDRRLPMRGATGVYYSLPSLPPLWDSVAVAKQIFYERKHDESADADAMLVLQWCFDQLVCGSSNPTSSSSEDAVPPEEQALALFDQMRAYVISGLLDPRASHASSRVILSVSSLALSEQPSVAASALGVATELLGADGPVAALLPRLVTRDVEDERQQAAVRLLHDVHAMGEQLAAAVSSAVASVRAASQPEAWRASLFSIALDV